jgi:hypothetical protein
MMSDRMAAFIVPEGIMPNEITVLRAALREATEALADEHNQRADLAEIKARGIEGPGAIEIILLLSGGGLWFTKKWADEYLWPILRRKIDRPSKALSEWLDHVVTRGDRSGKSDDNPR